MTTHPLTKRVVWYLVNIAVLSAIYVVGRAIMQYNGYPDIQWPSYILGAIIGALAVPQS